MMNNVVHFVRTGDLVGDASNSDAIPDANEEMHYPRRMTGRIGTYLSRRIQPRNFGPGCRPAHKNIRFVAIGCAELRADRNAQRVNRFKRCERDDAAAKPSPCHTHPAATCEHLISNSDEPVASIIGIAFTRSAQIACTKIAVWIMRWTCIALPGFCCTLPRPTGPVWRNQNMATRQRIAAAVRMFAGIENHRSTVKRYTMRLI